MIAMMFASGRRKIIVLELGLQNRDLLVGRDTEVGIPVA
jgi:hypothetical protein